MSEWFEQPELLSLGLAFLPIAIWDAARKWGGGRTRQVLSVALRFLLLCAILAGIARPKLTHDEQIGHVLFVVDRSASIPDNLLNNALTRVEELRADLDSNELSGLILFDGEPEVVVYPGNEWERPQALRAEPVDQTDVGRALHVALALIPEGEVGRVVLLSDARVTHGDMQTALTAARQREIAVTTIPIEPDHADPAITQVSPDRTTIRPGETFTGSVTLRGGPVDSAGRLHLALGAEEILVQEVTLPAGESVSVPFEYAAEDALEPGLAVLQAEWLPDDPATDAQQANNSLTMGLNVEGPPEVLIVASALEEVENLKDQLEAEEMAVTLVSVADFEASELQFSDFDLLVLGNVPALVPDGEEATPVLSTERIDEIRHYVSGGGGLVVLGGDKSYELGGYGQTELATVLPIELEPRDPEIEPDIAMVMILDNSGSMGSWAEGGTKMDLANQGAAAAMRLLRPSDYLAVMAVDDRVDQVVPLQRVTNQDAMARSILGIPVGGGGIYVYTSLREAYRQMRRVDAPIRHVILFSDAADSEEQVSGVIFGWGPGPNSYDLARAMHSEGITVSVIGIGSEYDQDANFLRNLASAGGGRYYLTARASELETLFVEETQRLVDSILNESNFRVRREIEHPIVEGLEFRRSPRLSGLIELEARETAEVILTHPDGFPVLTTWRYGLGQVAALAVDAGPRWSAEWLDWEGYGTFWSQLSRWAIRRHEGDDTAVDVAHSDTGTYLTVARRTPEGLTELEGGLQASLHSDGGERAVSLRIVEPGLWEADLETAPNTRYVVRITDSTGEIFAEQSFVAPGSPEFQYSDADYDFLMAVAGQTGGVFAPQDTLGKIPLSERSRHEELWLFCLGGALILLPIDAFLRRSGRFS